MKGLQITFDDLKFNVRDKFFKDMIYKIEEKYDVDIYSAYDCTHDRLRIRMIDKNDNNIECYISFYDLRINALEYFECQLEGMAKQLLTKEKKRKCMKNMTVKDLKEILNECPDNMPVIIPVIDEDDANHIYGFRHVKTVGILTSDGEEDACCLNAAADEQDIADQVHFSGRDVGVKSILFGMLKYDKKEKGENV